MKNWDHDIIKEFIPIEDKSSFLAFDNIILRGDLILALYRTLLGTERIVISLSVYLSKKREKKINEILYGI
jgi:hypothetical protein